MSVIVNLVRRGFYMDSVALMRLSRELQKLAGVEEAGLMMGTPANKVILQEADVLGPEGEDAGPGDLIVAARARDGAAADAARAHALAALERPAPAIAAAGVSRPRTIRSAVRGEPAANLALISVPGPFAAAEGLKALKAGLNVMMFSDNVPIAEEALLKREASARGLIVMGPDCGTAIIGGVPLAFANRVRKGLIGIVGASGTGIQEVSTLIDRMGHGISHAIGTGGRDLKAEVGAITTLAAIDLLDADPATRHIVLISKPPAGEVAKRVVARIARSPKPCTVCFLGADRLELPANAQQADTLERAAELASGESAARRLAATIIIAERRPAKARKSRGLFCGGTLCAEAQVVFRQSGLDIASNAPIPGVRPLTAGEQGNVLIDLGDDEFTRGRPHPMIEPGVRDAPMLAALDDPSVDAILFDIVLGLGSHIDPAGHMAQLLSRRTGRRPFLAAAITGTAADPQGMSGQLAALRLAGVTVCYSGAEAARKVVEAMARA